MNLSQNNGIHFNVYGTLAKHKKIFNLSDFTVPTTIIEWQKPGLR
jgi:hypothetical protein